ncbi:STM3941 family protein [Tenacibaculum sp. MEBiC07804]
MMKKTLILKTKKWKTLIYLIGCLIFIIPSLYFDSEFEFIDWIGFIFFGLGVVIFGIQLLPNSNYLKLNKEGFEVKNLYKSDFTKWTDIENFKVGDLKFRYYNKKMVMIDYSESYNNYKTSRKISNYFSGSDGTLPDNYGMKTEELVKVLNEWKSEMKNATQQSV